MNIYVYADWISQTENIGNIYVEQSRGTQKISFEYSSFWLNYASNHSNFFLDPDLENYRGRQFLNPAKEIFGMLADASPDRWGRTLLARREQQRAKLESRSARLLYAIDYLIGVYDESRMGALRFKLDPNGPFIDDDSELSVPPIADLRELEAASRAYENDEDFDNKWINQLVVPGSSLGGARPKATVRDLNGDLWIAKFPSKHDMYDQAAWEMIAHELAKMCGINMPEARLQKFSDLGSTVLFKRFDRDGSKRIHYASAMSLLGLQDGDNATAGHGYLDIVQFIRAYSKHPAQDLRELFTRVAFSIAISNTDDHFRNHAFLLDEDGWKLSPAFDINPSVNQEYLALYITEAESRMSNKLLLSTAQYYLLSHEDAKEIVNKVDEIVELNWEKLAKRIGISHQSIEMMRSAFRRKE